ncbi:MAG: hypothetical protein OK454_00010 [Thaumarchaeota archaeon]|nr:hypothetical protein [Nitrososphaerota archaeon]
MSDAALDMMWALRLEDNRHWGEAAYPFQVQDAEAIFSEERPNWHFITRPRGGSKTSDLAGIALSWLTMDAQPLANGHVVAASTDQAAIMIDAVAGFVARTPELSDSVVVESKRIVSPGNGAWVEVLAQSDSGAWGLRDAHLLICDEFCQWPETRGAKRVWRALQSAAPKVPGCKLIILSSAGEPSHWSHEVYEKCQEDPLWRISEAPGPVPWLAPEELESLRWHLRPSEYERLVLNIWSQDEDRAVSEEDWAFAARDYTSLYPVQGVRYIITVDIGVLDDASVMVISHKEPITPSQVLGPQRVVIDHVERWKGSKKSPIQVSAVEDWLAEKSPEWNRAPVYADPSQFRGSIQNLNLRGVRAKEFPFTATSVGDVATALVQTFRNRQIYVPDLPLLKDELLKVRLRESSPGVTRLDHDRGAHDDQAVTIGMACRIHLGDGNGLGRSWIEHMRRIETERELNPMPPVEAVTPRAYFMSGNDPPKSGDRPNRCKHRWFGDEQVCVNCGVKHGEVA